MSTASTGRPSAVRNSALTVPSLRVRLVDQLERRERDALGQRGAQRGGQVGHRVVAVRAGRGPAPHLAGAEGGLAELGQRRVEEREVHGPYGGSDMRLAKFLAHAGVASRRAAEQLVFAGRVAVGGEVVRDPARDVGEADAVAVDGRAVALERRQVVYALNKPAGYVSTAKDPQGRPTVVSLVEGRERLYPVGRLDADTTGLLLLTNDGELAHRLTHPSFEVPRVYRAQVRRPPVREPALRRLREGVKLEDGVTAPGARAPAHARPRRARSCTRAASGRCGACSTPSGTRSCGSSASPSARCGWATSRSAGTGC